MLLALVHVQSARRDTLDGCGLLEEKPVCPGPRCLVASVCMQQPLYGQYRCADSKCSGGLSTRWSTDRSSQRSFQDQGYPFGAEILLGFMAFAFQRGMLMPTASSSSWVRAWRCCRPSSLLGRSLAPIVSRVGSAGIALGEGESWLRSLPMPWSVSLRQQGEHRFGPYSWLASAVRSHG